MQHRLTKEVIKNHVRCKKCNIRVKVGSKCPIAKMEYNEKRRGIKRDHGSPYKTLAREKIYLDLFEEQEGKCAICGKIPTTKKLCIDHDHKTGKIRGLLCNECNVGLGMFSDSSRLLRLATLYLKIS